VGGRDLVQVEDVAVRVGEEAHEAAPGLPRGRHGERDAQCREARVLELEVADGEAHAGMTPDQATLFRAGHGEAQLHRPGAEGRVAVSGVGAFGHEAEHVAVEGDRVLEVADEDVHVGDLHDAFPPSSPVQPNSAIEAPSPPSSADAGSTFAT
jgi:hypothetical protein